MAVCEARCAAMSCLGRSLRSTRVLSSTRLARFATPCDGAMRCRTAADQTLTVPCACGRLADERAAPMITPSAGVHITLPAYFWCVPLSPACTQRPVLTRSGNSPEAYGLIVPKTKDGRVVFLLPWLGAAIAGTTDAPAPLTMEPRATAPEVDFILDALGDYITIKPRREDVLSAWSGIRPLAADPTKGSTENITRDHVLAAESGMLTITGGKWTTYRKARAAR